MKDLILGIIIFILGWCAGVISLWCLFAMSWG